jgi:hypothetical protein
MARPPRFCQSLGYLPAGHRQTVNRNRVLVGTEEHVQGSAEEAAGDFAFVHRHFPVALRARMMSKTGYTRDNPVIRRIEEVVRSPQGRLRRSKLPICATSFGRCGPTSLQRAW